VNERLAQVAHELAAAASAAPGPDGKRRLPVVQPRDAAGLVAMMHDQLDAAIEHREATAARQGWTIACTRGCTSCCATPVVVGEAEAAAVAEWLQQPEHAAARASFEAAYPRWRAQLGSLVEELVARGASEEARRTAGAAYHARRAMCPFNRGGDCTIYPVRPALCRKAHALWTPDRCAEAAGEIDYFADPEVEDTYAAQDGMRTVLHAALRGDRDRELLAKAVKRRLDGPSAGRNDPCVCGSGRKLKKCCGA
jgi:Fe-S-cluster containining protein